MTRALFPLVTALTLAALAAGCGASGFAGLAPPGSPIGARQTDDDVQDGWGPVTAGWEEKFPIEQFTSGVDNWYFDQYVPDNDHPFFAPLKFTTQPLGQAGGLEFGNRVLELIAAPSRKTRKGTLVRKLDEEEGSFFVGDEEHRTLAARVKVGFRWANNTAAAVATPSRAAMVIFVFAQKGRGEEPERKALAYVWNTTALPAKVLRTTLPLGEDVVEMRVMALEKGIGLGQPCSEAAFRQLKLQSVVRDFVADVRYAYDDANMTNDPAAFVGDRPALKPGESFPPKSPEGERPNDKYLGIEAIGFGAEVVRDVCSHAIVDDVAFQLKRKP